MKTKQIICLLLALIIAMLCFAGCRKDTQESIAVNSADETAEASKEDETAEDANMNGTTAEDSPNQEEEQNELGGTEISDEPLIIDATEGDEIIVGGE